MTVSALLALSLAAGSPPGAACSWGPEYYAIPLVTTRNLAGTGLARGFAEVAFRDDSPFVVSITGDGSYAYRIDLGLEGMRVPRRGTLVAWVTTPDIDRVERIGPLDQELRASGTVAWNKFLVVVTLEDGDDATQATWAGPIAFRGMSRSGMMHTMAGHGAFQQENCAAFGYGR